MAMRAPAGFISAFFDPLKNPDAPTSPSASAGDASASVSFTAPANVGGSAITAYYAVSNPGQITGTAASSPVSVTGLTNGTSYTFNVWALNSYGPGVWSSATSSVTPAAPRGLFGGGYLTASSSSRIDYITITTTGNATTFGNLTVARDGLGACSSTTRGVFGGGFASGVNSVVMDYVTIASTGNATSFGSLSDVGLAGASNSTRGLFITAGGTSSTIQYITIATTGNSTAFGDLYAGNNGDSACSSPTRALIAGNNSNICYVTIATTGNASLFGSLTVARSGMGSCASSTIGLFFGGAYAPSINVIDQVTIATTGNATSFGQLTQKLYETTGTGSNTRGVIGGGYLSSAPTGVVNTITYVTFASASNSTAFGDLTIARQGAAGCSNASGGLQ